MVALSRIFPSPLTGEGEGEYPFLSPLTFILSLGGERRNLKSIFNLIRMEMR